MRTTTLLSILFLALPLHAAEMKVHRALPYADAKNEKQTLDVYAAADGKDLPIVVWIHGGGWRAGDKKEVENKPQAFVDNGMVFVSINYRLLPEVTINQMAGDVAKAIKWIHDHAKDYGGNPNRLIIAGHSAGAQLAALVCTDERYLKAEGLSFAKIKGCIPVDGDTYDVPLQIRTVAQKIADIYRIKFGDEANQKMLSPVTHVARDKNIPPFLILHVAKHPETKLQSQTLAKALQAAGVSAKAYPAEGKDHATINNDLGLKGDRPTAEMFAFLNDVLRVEFERAKSLAAITPTFQPPIFQGDEFPPVDVPAGVKAKTLFFDRDHNVVFSPQTPGMYGAVVLLTADKEPTTRRYVTLVRLGDVDANEKELAPWLKAAGIHADVATKQAALLDGHVKKRSAKEWMNDANMARLLGGLSLTKPGEPQTRKYDDALARERQWWVEQRRILNGWDKTFAAPVALPRKIEGPAAVTVREGTLAEAGMKADAAEKIDAALKAWAADTDQAFAVCIVRHGVIAFHKAYGERDGKPMTTTTKSWMASITKPMAAMLMLMLIDQGKLDFDDDVRRFFPSLKNRTANKTLKVRQLFNHTAGLAEWGNGDDRQNDFEERLVHVFPKLKVGEKWQYGGTGNVLGGKILEAISGEALPRFYQNHLLGPLGCPNTDVIGSHADCQSVPFDIAKFGQLLLNKGAYGDRRYFSEANFEKALPRKLIDDLGPDARSFGFGIDGSPRKFGHGAASAATFSVDVDRDLVVVMTRNAIGRNYDKHNGKFWGAINESILPK